MPDKSIRWVGSALDDLRRFPDDARRLAGYQLGRLQAGRMPTDWKPMSSVGSGVQEMRIHTSRAHRVIYIAKLADAIYVLHAFEKRTWQTPKLEIELAKARLRKVLLNHEQF